MKPSENLEDTIKNELNFTAGADLHDRMLNDVLNAQEKSKRKQPASTKSSIRRKIMRSPITNLATVAGIVLALFIGVSLFNETSVVWAEVAKKVENCRGFTCQLKEIRTMKVAEKEVEIRTEGQMYGSNDYGMRQDRYQDGKLVITVYLNLADNEMVSVLHQMEKYGREPLEEGFADEFAQVSPQKIVSDMLSKEHEVLSRRVIDGREAEGIEVSYNDVTTRVWVALDSQWPILYEIQKAGESQPYLVMDNFQWEVELEKNLFEPNIPEDYTLLER